MRESYCTGESTIGFRCSGEPVRSHIHKGGDPEETEDRRCLCNGLLATVGLAQTRRDGMELPIVTAGEDLGFVPHVIERSACRYGARRVIEYLCS